MKRKRDKQNKTRNDMETNKETIKRIIDFLTGVVFAINGNIRRVANST